MSVVRAVASFANNRSNTKHFSLPTITTLLHSLDATSRGRWMETIQALDFKTSIKTIKLKGQLKLNIKST